MVTYMVMGHSMVREMHITTGQSRQGPDTVVLILEGDPRKREMYAGASNPPRWGSIQEHLSL